MPHYRAEWLLPISQPPIRDAWLRTDRGRIVAFGHSRPGDLTAPDEFDLGNVAVLPALVNAHTHLELSWMRGRVPAADDFPAWLRAVLELRRSGPGQIGVVEAAIAEAIQEARAFGTGLVGDISNTLATSIALAMHEMPAMVFLELIGFQSAEAANILDAGLQALRDIPAADDVRHSLAPHAPYSVSPALFAHIRALLNQDPFARTTIHLGESRAEVEFLLDGTGPCKALLEELGKWDPAWAVPECSPVEYAERLGFLDDRVVVAHGVQFGPTELKRIAAKGATLVTCPRGNIRTGAGEPPVADFFESGIRVALGTDSLASVPDLNLFAELAEMRRLAPHLPARLLLEAATINGACALGFEPDFGTIDSGKRDSLVAVRLDGQPGSIEEYLLSGIDAEQIHWVSRL